MAARLQAKQGQALVVEALAAVDRAGLFGSAAAGARSPRHSCGAVCIYIAKQHVTPACWPPLAWSCCSGRDGTVDTSMKCICLTLRSQTCASQIAATAFSYTQWSHAAARPAAS